MTLKRLHAVLTILWLVMVPVALVTGWIASIVFVSAPAASTRNAVGHFSAWQASRAEEAAQ